MKINNFLLRTITGLLFVVLVIGSILLNQYVFGGLFLIFTILGMDEFYRLVENDKVKPQKISGIITGALIYICLFTIYDFGFNLFILLALLFPVIIFELFRKKENPVINISVTLFGIIFIAIPFGMLNLLYSPDFIISKYPELLLGFFLIIWLYDTGAYIFGNLFGRHKMFERISPKKTWEGFAGGAIFSLLLVFILSNYFKYYNSYEWLIFAAITIISATFGDLSESLLKRSVGVKDSGKIFPGHGGILDRFDSVFIAAPFSFLCAFILNLLK